MLKQTVIGITCFLLGVAGGMAAFSNAEPTTRVEILGGSCQHRFAPDSSWSYREWGNYETNMDLSPKCYQLGVSYLPFQLKGWDWGFRAAYVDLGRIDADNTFPVNEPEYFRAKETKTPVNSPTERFQGTGGARGLTLGLATERKVGPLHVGPEGGLALLYSRWHVESPDVVAILNGCRSDWACADGWKATAYVGLTARYGWLMVSARRYLNVRASQAQDNPLYIGPTTGPVDAVMVGLSIPL